MDRRRFVKSLSAAATVASVSSLARTASAQSGGNIRIGLLAPLTGVLAAGGKELVEGFELFWKQSGTTVAGRRIEIIISPDLNELFELISN